MLSIAHKNMGTLIGRSGVHIFIFSYFHILVLLFYAILSHGLKLHKHEEIIWYYYMEFIFL